MSLMATDPKVISLKGVWHHWRYMPDDPEMKLISVQLAAREGNTIADIAERAGTSVEVIEPMVAADPRNVNA